MTLSDLNGDMKIPNNKNIIFFLDSRERKFKTPNIIDGIFPIELIL